MKNRLSFDQQIEVADRRLRELAEHDGKAPPPALEAFAASLAELRRAGGELEAGRQAAQAELQAERALTAAVLDTAAMLVIVLDREGRILRFNRACEQATGYTADEVAGRRFWDFPLLPEEAAPARAAFDALRAGRFPNQFEHTWVARDGSRRLIAWTNTAILGPDGAVETIVGTGLDITARWRAEHALRESEEKFKKLFDVLPIGISILDAERRVVDANPALEAILSLSRADLLAGTYTGRKNFRPDGTPMAAEELASTRAFKEQQIVRDVEIGVQKEDGTFIWTNVSAAPFDLPGLSLAIITQDITAQVQAASQREAALAERERLLEENRRQRQFLERLLETAPIGVAVLRGADHRFEFVNAAYQAFSANPDTPMVGRTVAEVFPAAVAQGALGGVEAIYRTGQAVSLRENESNAGPGREHTYWDSDRVPLRAPDGSVEGVLIVAREVTEEVLARRRVAELAARDEAILNSLAEGIITVDPQGNVLAMNPAAVRIHGFAHVEQARPRPPEYPDVFELRGLDGRLLPMDEWPLGRLLREETFSGYEVQVRRLDSGATWIGSYSGTPVRDTAGTMTMGVLTLRDVTAQKQAESQSEAALAALKAALAEKEVLMREIYHRVKNNVQALIYLIEMQAEESPDEAGRQLLHELQERARAMALVHEKLYQSQNLAQVDFGDYLYDLVDNLSRAFGAGRPIVWRIAAEDVPLGVDAAIPCGLIVSELLTNALKYAFPAGAPGAGQGTDCTISVASRADGDQITLIVSDNGVGLPPGVDWSTTRTLGLQLVNILARHQLGGQVEVDRRGGTAFKITFADRERKRP